MATLLLVMIYLAFISLGLPDSLLGSAWPVMYGELGVSLSAAGYVTVIISCGTIVSSLFSSRGIKKLGTGPVTLISVAITAGALAGISRVPSFLWLCVLAVPLGLGAGAVDSALNNFVALHYRASHMNWLHCFWGIGATGGPIIMSLFLARESGWKTGFRTVAWIQIGLVTLLAASLPLWNRVVGAKTEDQAAPPAKSIGIRTALKLPGAKPALLAFFCYCAVEYAAGLWGSSYLVQHRGLDAQTAAQWISLYYFGITVGRGLAGILTARFSNRQMIRLGQLLLMGGIAVLLLPFGPSSQIGFILIGLGCAPIFPAMLHETPKRFGAEYSQSLMGIQMACAYTGATCMPFLFGQIAERRISLLPYFMFLLAAVMFLSTQQVNRTVNRREI